MKKCLQEKEIHYCPDCVKSWGERNEKTLAGERNFICENSKAGLLKQTGSRQKEKQVAPAEYKKQWAVYRKGVQA